MSETINFNQLFPFCVIMSTFKLSVFTANVFHTFIQPVVLISQVLSVFSIFLFSSKPETINFDQLFPFCVIMSTFKLSVFTANIFYTFIQPIVLCSQVLLMFSIFLFLSKPETIGVKQLFPFCVIMNTLKLSVITANVFHTFIPVPRTHNFSVGTKFDDCPCENDLFQSCI